MKFFCRLTPTIFVNPEFIHYRKILGPKHQKGTFQSFNVFNHHEKITNCSNKLLNEFRLAQNRRIYPESSQLKLETAKYNTSSSELRDQIRKNNQIELPQNKIFQEKRSSFRWKMKSPFMTRLRKKQGHLRTVF